MNRNLFIRLAFAAHRVADVLPDEELKQEIKESANAILADLILFAEKEGLSSEKRKSLVPQILKQIDALLVYLDRVKREGWMRADNFSILEGEYARIKDFLSLFESIEEPGKKVQRVQESEDLERREKKEKPKKPAETPSRTQVLPKSGLEAERGALTERQKKIIEFLKRKESAQVWELQKILPQVTKRTLRRDLDSLLQLNLVERKGEWNSVVYELKERDEAMS